MPVMASYYTSMRVIYLAMIAANLLFPVSAQSDDVVLSIDADLIGWEAYLAYASSNLSRGKKADRLSNYLNGMSFFSPVFAQDLEWRASIGFDWQAYRLEEIKDTLGFDEENQLMQTQTFDEQLNSSLPAIQYLAFEHGFSIAEGDYYTDDLYSVSVENTIRMPATVLLIFLGLIGLAGFARKSTKPTP